MVRPRNHRAARCLVLVGAVGLAAAMAGASCANIIGADGDYYDVGASGTGGAAASSGTGGAGGASSTGSAGQGGSTNGGQGGEAGAGGAGGAGGSAPIVWSSWDVVSDAGGARVTAGNTTATIELYRSVSLTDLSVEATFDQFYVGPHPDGFNHVESYWALAVSANAYPYGGKSTVDRGNDTGETAMPMPLGVRDLQLHPPNTDQLVVVAFVAPVAASYTATDLAVRRVHDQGEYASLVLHSPCNAPGLVSLQAANDRAWVVATQSYPLGSLSAGERICFGVSRDDNYSWDAVEVSWTITADL